MWAFILTLFWIGFWLAVASVVFRIVVYIGIILIELVITVLGLIIGKVSNTIKGGIMSRYYATNITPVLAEIEDALWEIDARERVEPYEYPSSALRSALKIFMSVSMDRLWLEQEANKTAMDVRGEQAYALGEDIKKLVKKHLGVDTTSLYERKK